MQRFKCTTCIDPATEMDDITSWGFSPITMITSRDGLMDNIFLCAEFSSCEDPGDLQNRIWTFAKITKDLGFRETEYPKWEDNTEIIPENVSILDISNCLLAILQVFGAQAMAMQAATWARAGLAKNCNAESET